MYYPEELIEEVRQKKDIVDVLSGYVKLQKKGSSYFGLCPFHNEKSPSFSVSRQKQMYYCFGCGAGGNVFTFLMEYENFTFPEAVKALADRVYDNRNMAAQAASGSSCADAMVIAPCSMKTLAGIAMGYDDSLLVRAADVMLKERRRLILLTRETPLNLSHIRNMETVTLMGGIILPPVPAFYSRPQTVDDIVDQTVSRTLRLLGLDGGERFRWNGNG